MRRISTSTRAREAKSAVAANAPLRRSKYGEETVDAICRRLRLGESLSSISRDVNLPHRDTLMDWIATNRFGFADRYEQARRVSAHLFVEKMLDVALDSSRDHYTDEKGVQRPDTASVQRSKLIVDTLKWTASKMMPRLYGDSLRQEHEVTGDLARLLETASNRDNGLPPPIDE